MKRDFLVFEFFSLVVPSQKDLLEDANITLMGTDADDSLLDMKRRESNRKPNELVIEDDLTDEASIRRKIKQMCSKPQKQLVRFYNEESDISLYQMIKKLATQALHLCDNKECKKIRLLHTDYYYHHNGCVEIKYREEPSNQEA